MSLLEARFAVVTGGTRGIGGAIAARLAAEGAAGAALDLPDAAGTVPEGWQRLGVDVRDEGSVREAFAGLAAVDVLVAAAGIVPGWAALPTPTSNGGTPCST